MKKLLILIGLTGFLICNAQRDVFYWEVQSHGKNDTTAYDKRGSGPDWAGCYVTIDVTIWNLEDTTGYMYFGGYSNKVTINTGVQDFKYLPSDDIGIDVSPLLIDTVSGTYLRPNADSSRYSVKLEKEHFPFQKPAMKYEMNDCDSVEYYILFTGVRQ